MSGFAEGYVDVASRIEEFYAKHPHGSLEMDDIEWVTVDGATFIKARARAFRTPDDPRPGVGWAWEPVPGRTPYTNGSELMNLETSCWGRALAALGIATRNGIATRQEVEGAEGRRTTAPQAQGHTGSARTATITEKQLGYLKRLMREANTPEWLLADLAKNVLGFTAPDNLEDLSKDHATQLIDALKKMLDGGVVTRSKPAEPPHDPWAVPPVDPETGELAL